MGNMVYETYLPDGFVRFTGDVFTDGSIIVLVGETPPDEAGELAHDCDQMGCGSAGPHVIAKGVINWDSPEWRAKEIAAALELAAG